MRTREAAAEADAGRARARALRQTRRGARSGQNMAASNLRRETRTREADADAWASGGRGRGRVGERRTRPRGGDTRDEDGPGQDNADASREADRGGTRRRERGVKYWRNRANSGETGLRSYRSILHYCSIELRKDDRLRQQANKTAAKPVQLEMTPVLEPGFRWGGKRANAGRKLAGRGSVQHRARPVHNGRHPVHVTLRARSGLPSFRQQRVSAMLRAVLVDQRKRRYAKEFQVAELSIQDNHLHLIVEATGVLPISPHPHPHPHPRPALPFASTSRSPSPRAAFRPHRRSNDNNFRSLVAIARTADGCFAETTSPVQPDTATKNSSPDRRRASPSYL